MNPYPYLYDVIPSQSTCDFMPDWVGSCVLALGTFLVIWSECTPITWLCLHGLQPLKKSLYVSQGMIPPANIDHGTVASLLLSPENNVITSLANFGSGDQTAMFYLSAIPFLYQGFANVSFLREEFHYFIRVLQMFLSSEWNSKCFFAVFSV